MRLPWFLLLTGFVIPSLVQGADDWIRYEGKAGPGQGKHLVFLCGDEEYRGEEGLPMLAKILSQRHGFTCTVLFSVDDQGVIDPKAQGSLSGAEQLDTADAIVMLLRFRNWPDEQASHFVNAFKRGIPVIGLRTSTHAFKYPGKGKTSFGDLNRFGKDVLGEQWVSHWGKHKREATLGVVESTAADHPILNGVGQIFGDSDVYEAYPPEDAEILVRGQVLVGMSPDDPPAAYAKKRRSDGVEQDINGPMMPVAWTRTHEHGDGVKNRVFCTTLGAATDLQSEGLRRMIVNSVYWGLKLDVPKKGDVSYVDPYVPSAYGFGTNRPGIKPADHELGKTLP
ncbi:MAG: ThuA domain-containing protein [Planctomycetaceae bacterium]|nr:ThuA domain-containing protein [Planctomycetaceae bacterium]